jgi:hypothetical protein
MEALHDPIEEALVTLETTTDYAAGEAALAIVNKRFATANWLRISEVILVLSLCVLVGLIRELWPQHRSVALLVLALIIAARFFVLGRRNIPQRKRALAAVNRWDQIAGTLAVQVHRGEASR